MVKNIKWLGHASIKVETEGKNVYIDPWKLKNYSNKADLILITHSHHDHFSPNDISKLTKKDTIIIGPADVIKKIAQKEKKVLLPGQTINLNWVTIEGVPSYNIDKAFHPKSNNWLGFILRCKESSIYIAGDTDFIPEMKDIKVDVAILPVGGTYTMNPKQASEATNTIKPKVVIPIHFGDVVGTIEDAKSFESMVKESKVEILQVTE